MTLHLEQCHQNWLTMMVLVAGLEPAYCCQRGILSPLCLPIPPSGRGLLCSWQLLRRQGAGVARRGPSRYTAPGSAVTGETRKGRASSHRSALPGPCRRASLWRRGRRGWSTGTSARGRHGLSGSGEGKSSKGCPGGTSSVRGILFVAARLTHVGARHPLVSPLRPGGVPSSSIVSAVRVRGVVGDAGSVGYSPCSGRP